MLTLRFNMEREHAQIIEEEAKKKLREIKIKKPGKVYTVCMYVCVYVSVGSQWVKAVTGIFGNTATANKMVDLQ